MNKYNEEAKAAEKDKEKEVARLAVGSGSRGYEGREDGVIYRGG